MKIRIIEKCSECPCGYPEPGHVVGVVWMCRYCELIEMDIDDIPDCEKDVVPLKCPLRLEIIALSVRADPITPVDHQDRR